MTGSREDRLDALDRRIAALEVVRSARLQQPPFDRGTLEADAAVRKIEAILARMRAERSALQAERQET
jgi:hypothetical protein